MANSTRQRGFSLLEMLTVVGIALLLTGIAAPTLMNTVGTVKIHYAAVDLSGLLQKARMEAVRKNTFYPVRQNPVPNHAMYYVDESPQKDGTYSSGYPLVDLGQFAVFEGTGSGAPQEGALEGSFNFLNGFYPSTATFNARGLPCLFNGGATCVQDPGKGFIYYLSGPRNSWAAVVITPSGRVQVWMYDNSNNGRWVQQ
jgi:prepilin-type N-terminal cleavage/methylation domain-containing protein